MKFNPFILLAVLFLVFILFFFIQNRLRIRNERIKAENYSLDAAVVEKNIVNWFQKIDVIKDDMRWVGENSEIVYWKRDNRKEHGFVQELLCRTKNGVWFIAEFELDGFNLRYVQIHPITVAAAKSQIEWNKNIYTKYFSLPEIA